MTQHSISLALAGITFLLTVIWGPPLIRILRGRRSLRPEVAADGGDSPLPMGGLLFTLPVALLTLLLNFAGTSGWAGVGLSILLPLAGMLSFATLGAWMDWQQLHGRSIAALRRWWYFAVQAVLAIGLAAGLKYVLDVPDMYFPFYKGELPLGMGFLPAAALVILVMVNAFQASSDVDGLAGLIGGTAFAVYGAVAVVQEQTFIARFCFTVVGALLGFLWFNISPAALHIGRTGAYAIGASLAVVAHMTGQWPLLAVIALVPLLELGSIGLKWAAGGTAGERFALKAAPLHAHFLALGWSATQVVQRFWLVTLLFGMIGFTLALV